MFRFTLIENNLLFEETGSCIYRKIPLPTALWAWPTMAHPKSVSDMPALMFGGRGYSSSQSKRDTHTWGRSTQALGQTLSCGWKQRNLIITLSACRENLCFKANNVRITITAKSLTGHHCRVGL